MGGVKFWCYTAGHVLGAAMFMIEIAGVKVKHTRKLCKKLFRHPFCLSFHCDVKSVLFVSSSVSQSVCLPACR